MMSTVGSSAELDAIVRSSLPVYVIATLLLTVAAGLILFSLIAGWRKNVALLLAGGFVALYGLRLALNSQLTDVLLYSPSWMPYLRSAMEYLVPIPGAGLFAYYFGSRWRKVNFVMMGALITLAVVAIPAEIILRRPYALKGVIDALVILMMVVLAYILLTPEAETTTSERTHARSAAAIFAAFVLNEHFRVVNVIGLSLEPIGFMIFIGTLISDLMHRGVEREERLAGVEAELSTARSIQLSLIPERAPTSPHFEIGTAYVPASEVGGDFYDFANLSPEKLGIFIADVAGHGVPAALVASMLKIAFAASDDTSSPDRVLTSLNHLFTGRLKRQFFTAAYLMVDAQRGEAIVATGGHPPLLHASRDGVVAEVSSEGFVLGRLVQARFGSIVVPFREGEQVVLVTDGLIESRNAAGEEWGYERLKESIRASSLLPARAMAHALVKASLQWSGSKEAGDDMTVVVVRRVAPSA